MPPDPSIREVDLDAVRELRREVFIEEQGVPEAEEWDSLDARATHFGAYMGKELAACARIVPSGRAARIGRVAVSAPLRGRGLGQVLMLHLIDWCRAHGHHEIVLDAQVQVVRFYRDLGFVEEGERFMDAGIEHVRMRRILS